MTSHGPRRFPLAVGAAAIAATAAFAFTPGTAPSATATTPIKAGAAADARIDQVGTWGTAVDSTALKVVDQTVRNIVHTSVGGSNLRISLSNAYGSVPVTFDSVWVGQAGQGAAIAAGSNRRLSFGGSPSVTVPVGAEVLSDPVPGDVPAQSTLSVSIHVVGDAGTVSGHKLAHQTNFISTPGDHGGEEFAGSFQTPTTSYAWVESAVVDAPQQVDTVVALGDSITDGDKSTTSTNRRWPNLLASRILAGPKPHQFGVMNAGISGNRVLADGPGVSAQARFDRDVLAQPDVSTVVVMEGVNDLRWELATKPADLIQAYRQLIGRAHARGVCIVGGTITPWEGGSLWSEPKDAIRGEVNAWIRTSGEFDAVVDFDAAVRDPAQPSRILAAYDSGDHLHPGDAGYQAMANAVDLDSLECTR
ncbi:putative secreted protein [Janibacter sp. HTCC2649]|uniref:SGNH/GDSL hydrolase family protein n=1 Tax=Janibacter sp. HTCC2649 TaxID=313589 RepID=UPI0000670932|nr:SGNH/GDSL hydrolase family protein [Janibacter sp. HTCC2649]EAQ00723.1 putative secreted protein [Janibacter sp. HTCC2649]